MVVGERNILHESLVYRKNIYLSPFHIKFEPIWNIVQDMDRDDRAFQHLTNKMPKVSEAKIEEYIFLENFKNIVDKMLTAY